MNYDAADKAIRDMNKRNLRAFDRLKTLAFDEANILREVTKVFTESRRLAIKRYLAVAIAAYELALIECGIDPKEARRRADEDVTEDWILDMMEDYDEVALYRFDEEVERKKARLVEALIASHNNPDEVEKALRLWTLQVAQFADNAVVMATKAAYEDAGVEKVEWVAEMDNRTCQVCEERDGKIYRIDRIPPIPHFRCRCTLVPVL